MVVKDVGSTETLEEGEIGRLTGRYYLDTGPGLKQIFLVQMQD